MHVFRPDVLVGLIDTTEIEEREERAPYIAEYHADFEVREDTVEEEEGVEEKVNSFFVENC